MIRNTVESYLLDVTLTTTKLNFLKISSSSWIVPTTMMETVILCYGF